MNGHEPQVCSGAIAQPVVEHVALRFSACHPSSAVLKTSSELLTIRIQLDRKEFAFWEEKGLRS